MKLTLLSLIAFLWVISPVQKASAQEENDCYLYGMNPLEVYSIFTESFKTKDYELAIMYGMNLLECNPKKMEQLPQYKGEDVFDKIIDIYVALSKKEKDPTKRTAQLDSSLKYFYKVFELYKGDPEFDEFNWILKRGRFYQENADFIQDGTEKSFADYFTLIEKDPKRITELGKGYYVQVTLNNLVSLGEKEKALEVIEKTIAFSDENTIAFIDKVRDQLFSNPTERIAFLESKLKDNPKDIVLLNDLYELYQKVNDLERARQTAKKMYDVVPNLKNILAMASIAKKNGDNKSSIIFLNEALTKTVSKEEKAKVYLDLADSYLLLEDLKKAREYAKKSISENSKSGQPYIKLASIFAQSVSQCAASNMEREDKAVYWLVLDYLDKAKQIDSEVTSLVNNLYKSYKPVTPSAEEKFFKGWKKGETIKIDKSLRDCYDWINETTTIR